MLKQKYNPARIQLLYQMLANSQQQGHPREYDIKVDELKVVQRTNDPEQFFCHEEFILPDTENITITFYEGTSNRNSRHVFLLNESQKETSIDAQTSLNGIEKILEEKMDKERQKWDMELLRKENESLKLKLDEAEEYNDQLETEITTLKDKKFETGKNIGAVVSGALEALVRNNTAILKRIPGGQALAGLVEEDNKRLASDMGNEESSADTTAFFTKKRPPVTEAENEASELKNINQQAATTGLDSLLVYQLQQIQQVIPPGEERERFNKILQIFAGSPHLVKDIWELLDEAYRQQTLTNAAQKYPVPAETKTDIHSSDASLKEQTY